VTVSAAAGDAGGSISRGRARFAFTLLFLLYVLNYIDRLVIVSLFPFLQRDWGLTDAQCGLLISAVYWSILGFTLPVSVLIDRWSRKRAIGLMAVAWSLATAVCAVTRGFGQLFAARMAVGIGEAGYAPGGTAMISALHPEGARARMIGIWNASIPLGSALGMAIGGLVAEHFGWRSAFGVVALPGLVVGLLFFGVTDYRTVELVRAGAGPDERAGTRMGGRELLVHFARNRTLVFNNLGFAANTFVTTALPAWLPSYFHRADGTPMSEAALESAGVMLLAIAGAPLGGYLADRWRRRRANARLLLPALSSAVTAGLLLPAFSVAPREARYAVLLAAGLTGVAFSPAASAVTQDVVHAGLRATSASVSVVVQHALGSALGPAFVGLLSDRYGLETAMASLPAFALLGALLFFVGSFFHDGDAAKVGAVARTANARPG
jgi:predicted MFS family arabinose efflux permease